MANTQTVRKKEVAVNQPINIGDRAFDNLKFIRETMESSTSFTAVPGYGGIFMGVTALAAAIIASSQPSIKGWLTVWLIEAFLACAVGFFAMWQKAKITKTSLLSVPAKKFAMSFAPPIFCAVFITFGLYKFGHFEVMIPVWILLYGAAVVCGGAYSARIVPIAGWCFMTLGAIAFLLPAGYGNAMMGLSFGILQIIFGAMVAWKHGG